MQVTITADGASAEMNYPPGKATVALRGTFDNAVVTPQVSFDGTNWTDVTDTASNAAGQKTLELAACKVRLNTATAGANTNVVVNIKHFTSGS